MSPRRAAIALATYVAAIVIALAVPVSQLRTSWVEHTCCCPDPSNCHCPDQKPDHSNDESIKACHKTQTEHVAPQLPSFSAPEVATLAPLPQVAPAVIVSTVSPHASPAADEPYGPS